VMAEAEMGKSPFSGIREVREATLVLAFFLGVATIAAAVLLGRKYSFFLSFLGFSVFMTLLWRKAPRPWVFLLSISAATPITVSKQQFTCNLIFALWFALLNIRDLFRLPKWIYLSSALALLGIITSMTNWMSGDVLSGAVFDTACGLPENETEPKSCGQSQGVAVLPDHPVDGVAGVGKAVGSRG
jgi:hypothetical protein